MNENHSNNPKVVKVRKIAASPQDSTPHRKNLFPVFAVVTVLLFILLFVIIGVLNSKIRSLSDRLSESEEYITVMNSRTYEYADPDDMFYFDDPTYGSTWVPLLQGVPLNTRDYTNLRLENDNRYTYYVNGEKACFTGIDVSYHQQDIDWEKVAADGIDFVILRVGYRGYETGAINKDSMFDQYITGASAAGLDVGVYFYSQALTEEEAAEEAKFVCETIAPYKISYPVIFDWEVVGDSSARTNDITPEELTACAVAFCNEISTAGYTPCIYGNLRMALIKYDMRGLSQYDFWFAQYKNGYHPPEYPYELSIWQYASDGKVDGVDGDVDLNICFTDYRKQYDSLQKIKGIEED